jgi:hypothetical protein
MLNLIFKNLFLIALNPRMELMMMAIKRKIWIFGLMIIAMGSLDASAGTGMIKSVKGDVSIKREGMTLNAKPGTLIQVSDTIVTGPDSTVGITLEDGTLLSAGPNSSLALNKFLFDSTTNKGALDATLKHGTLGVVSGKLSKTSPEAVTYRTPTTILGVRGTEFVIETESKDK